MSLAVLELNDQLLLIQAEEGGLHAEPGFARISADGIETGDAARATAWRQPQHGYNQYWAHLNSSPLATTEKHARHHADIAFAQLRQLWRQVGKPESLVLLAPGSASDTQLSLLLGMLGALPCEPLAVVDSALAAGMTARRDTLYVDVQLHQTVLSVLRHRDGEVSVEAQETFPQFGAQQVQNSVARYISNLLIDSARYDPLHSSESEQEIYDQLPGWLSRLRIDDELPAKLSTAQGDLPFILRRNAIRRLLTERLKSIRAFIGRHSGVPLLLSHASALLGAVAEEFSETRVLGQTDAADFVLSHHDALLDQVDGLYRVQSLRTGDADVATSPVNGRAATHLLLGDRALPLSRPVNLRLVDGRIEAALSLDERSGVALVMREQALEILHNATGLEARLPRSCAPGETVRLGDYELPLIEVSLA